MASQPRQFTIEKQTYKGAVPDGLAPVPMPSGEAGSAAAAGFGSLAEKFGRWADQDAKAEGERDARIAAASGNFEQSGRATIYGRARDATALDAQVTSVTSGFRDRSLALFDQHRNDPDGLRAALDRDARDSEAALPAEARAGFRARASDIGVALQRTAMTNRQSVQQDEARATLIRRSAENERNQSRMLVLGPEDPAVAAAVRQASAEQVEQIRNMARSRLMDASKAEQLIVAEEQAVEGRIIAARAGTLRSPEDVEAYRTMLRDQARAGTLPRSVDLSAVDAELVKLAQQKRVEGDRQQRELQTRLDDALARASRGQNPTIAEMAVLEQDAGRLGPRGEVALETMRSRMTLGQRLATLSLPEQERVYRQLQEDVQRQPAGGQASPAASQAVNFYMSRGWTRVQASAIVGHMMLESGLDTTARNRGDGRDGSDSIGVSQWNAHRAQALAAFAASRGKPVTDFETQLAFADAELRGQIAGSDESRWGRALMAAGDVRSASRAMISYLRPAGWSAANPEGGHNFSSRTAAAERLAGSATRAGAENLQWARQQIDANRAAVNADLLGYAGDRNLLGGAMTAVDMNAPPDQLAAQMTARVNQVDAVAPTLGQASPSYLRPDDKAALQGVMTAGGDRALAAVEAIVRGGGRRATAILKEIGGDAPALAHAAAIGASTGDRTFARTIAEGLAARQVQGARPAKPSGEDMLDAERTALGASLRGMRTDERERTQAAVGLWFEVEAQRRGIDPKQDPTRAKSLLEEGFRAARGETRQGDHAYGGVTNYRGRGWFGGEVQVQVPPQIRQDRFGAVIGAITDQDLAGVPNPPVLPGGNPMDAGALRRMQPIFGPGGYRWSLPPDSSGNRRPVMGRDGQPFVLDLNALEPELRRRVPDAFR